MSEKLFRFEDLEIWKRAAGITRDLLTLADGLEQRRLFRFAEQESRMILAFRRSLKR